MASPIGITELKMRVFFISHPFLIEYAETPASALGGGGIHGAGRLGCRALTECIVFGRIAGQQAAAIPGNASV